MTRLVKVVDDLAESAYQVVVDGQVVGLVESFRTESWRYSSGGRKHRTSLRGRPLHWEARAVGWLPVDARSSIDWRIGYRFETRGRAVQELRSAWRSSKPLDPEP